MLKAFYLVDQTLTAVLKNPKHTSLKTYFLKDVVKLFAVGS